MSGLSNYSLEHTQRAKPVVPSAGLERRDSPTVRAGSPTRAQIGVWLVLLAAAVTVSLLQYGHSVVGVYKLDDSAYIVLAESLVHADRYGLINAPGAPVPTHFPFGYPLVLSPFVVLFPGNLEVLKAVSLVATLLNAGILFWGWRWFRVQRSYWWAIAVVGLYVLSPLTVRFAGMVMSEPVFTTFCLLAILLAEQAANGRLIRGWFIWMGSTLWFAMLKRQPFHLWAC